VFSFGDKRNARCYTAYVSSALTCGLVRSFVGTNEAARSWVLAGSPQDTQRTT